MDISFANPLLFFCCRPRMPSKIKYLLYLDDDSDDHFIFSSIINENFPDVRLTLLDSCDKLMPYLMDMRIAFPDLIFLDMNIHGNQYFECLKELKNTKTVENIPVIIYSTSDSQKQALQALEVGAYKFVVKPFTFREAAEQLINILTEFETIDK